MSSIKTNLLPFSDNLSKITFEKDTDTIENDKMSLIGDGAIINNIRNILYTNAKVGQVHINFIKNRTFVTFSKLESDSDKCKAVLSVKCNKKSISAIKVALAIIFFFISIPCYIVSKEFPVYNIEEKLYEIATLDLEKTYENLNKNENLIDKEKLSKSLKQDVINKMNKLLNNEDIFDNDTCINQSYLPDGII